MACRRRRTRREESRSVADDPLDASVPDSLSVDPKRSVVAGGQRWALLGLEARGVDLPGPVDAPDLIGEGPIVDELSRHPGPGLFGIAALRDEVPDTVRRRGGHQKIPHKPNVLHTL